MVRGYLVPRDTRGFTAREVPDKMSLRASVTSELVLEDVRVPASAMLPGAEGLKPVLSCLTQARYGIAWGALGALEAVYSEALAFAGTRTTFGKPIAARQLVQEKLVRMVSDHGRGTAGGLAAGAFEGRRALRPAQVSLAKRDNVRAALLGARAAREILGAAGITVEHHAIRHMLNLETVDTYEGTHDVHTLVVGREVTGHSALSDPSSSPARSDGAGRVGASLTAGDRPRGGSLGCQRPHPTSPDRGRSGEESKEPELPWQLQAALPGAQRRGRSGGGHPLAAEIATWGDPLGASAHQPPRPRTVGEVKRA